METSNLIKIRNIILYSDIEQAPVKTADLLIVLKTHNIGTYHIIDESHNPTALDRLRGTSFGLDFSMYPSLTLPVITWQELYDDYERVIQIAQTPDDLSNSNLIKNSNLISLA